MLFQQQEVLEGSTSMDRSFRDSLELSYGIACLIIEGTSACLKGFYEKNCKKGI
jgi:hypothetical protein